jgi:hypothetical protein
MAQFDATEVFALMKRRGFVPSSASGFTEAEFIQSTADEIESVILPKLIKANTKHLIRTEDQTIVAGTSQYRVPDRCANNGIYSIWLVNPSNGLDPLDGIDADEVPKLGLCITAGKPRFYSFEGPYITLWPPPASGYGTLRVKYQIRPNRLVLVNTVGTVTTARAAGSTTIPVASTVPSNATGPWDIIRGRGSFEHLALNLTGTIASTTITVSGGIPLAIEVGDYVCNAYETPIPQLPHGLHLPAACRGVASILGARGNTGLYQTLITEAERREKEVLDSLVPRNQTEQQGFSNPWW